MATWQQGNAGGLLASLGSSNVNAPQASDANAALAYIRQNNEDDRSGRNNVGLQALQGISSVMDIYKQQEQAQRQQEFQQAYGNAYASGDRNAMRQLASAYPEQFDAVQKGMKFVDDEQRSTVGNLAASARLASSSPQAMGSWLQNNAADLARSGINPQDVAQMYQQNPQGFAEFADHLGMAALGPVDYYNAQDKIATQALNKDKLAEQVRSNQAGEALTAQGQYISASNAAADRAQRAQIHSDNVAMKLQELGMKHQESGKVDPKLVRDLNSDINGFSKNYSAMRGAADNLQALGERNTPAAQLGMIFNYMKSLDPQSVVREGEQVQVKRTDGVFGTMQNYVNQLSNGKMLNDSQVSDLINTSKLMANTEGKKFNQQMDDYLSTYGDSLPGGLTKQLQSRKAKLYEDIPQQQTTPIQVGHSEGGYTFLGGDPANPASWRKN